ncbi:conjugal transfer protein TraD [Sphingomonas sp. 35-24ZXX]|uniref:conjugal transfer protein TraD n=1 Tax=Sphingomonas sp. 35-24ZXX TaxID=1545915 RepID=UPI0009DD40AC|nr:conjugal transfer protein TraD [Sphingomonas sp. 35-24ZXX]
MRRPRDFDAELQALSDRAKALKAARLTQLGELVIATGADALGTEVLAGVLLAAVGNDDASRKEAWRKRGAAFFQQRTGRQKAKQQSTAATGGSSDSQPGGAAQNTGAAQPADAGQGSQ